MPITFSFKKLPVDADGVSYPSLEAFQAAEISRLLAGLFRESDKGVADEICAILVEKKESVIEILELTMDARPAARGKKKPRKCKTDVAPAELPIPQ